MEKVIPVDWILKSHLFNTGRYDKVDYVLIRVKDNIMESSLKSEYSKYFKKSEVFKYEDYGNPEKMNNTKEVQKIEKKYGYFIIFSEPIF